MAKQNPNKGSSPHTRGAPPYHRRGLSWRRIIPAYAGSTNLHHYLKETTWDHPRIRGEHHRLGCAGDFGRGSSPHTRGALRGVQGVVGDGRIIPAYAGSTSLASSGVIPVWDHPRIRGEHPRQRRLPDRPARIIPAYAGSTPSKSTP